MPNYLVKAGVTYRIVSDHLRSVRLVVNASTGAVVQRLDYDAFGNVTQDSNPGFQPFGFVGLSDTQTGLVRFRAGNDEVHETEEQGSLSCTHLPIHDNHGRLP